MFGRKLRTIFHALLLKPLKNLVDNVYNKQHDQRKYYEGENFVNFKVNDLVQVKDQRDHNRPSWIESVIKKIIERVG